MLHVVFKKISTLLNRLSEFNEQQLLFSEEMVLSCHYKKLHFCTEGCVLVHQKVHIGTKFTYKRVLPQ